MTLDNATIIVGVCGNDHLIGYETDFYDEKGQKRYTLGAICREDKDFFNKITNGQFCIASSVTARDISRVYKEQYPMSEYIFPFYGPKIIYTPSKRLKRNVHDVIDIALKDAKRWNKGKTHFDNIKKVYVCGGSQIYKEALKNEHVREMSVTYIPEKYKVKQDSSYRPIYFPEVNWNEWNEVGQINLNKEILIKKFRKQ